MGDVVKAFQTFYPRIPRDEDTELRINGDLVLIEQLVAKAVTFRTRVVRESAPLTPMKRKGLMDAIDKLDLDK